MMNMDKNLQNKRESKIKKKHDTGRLTRNASYQCFINFDAHLFE